MERAFFEHNRRAYASLSERGLLPPAGANIGSQDISEFLNSGGEVPRKAEAE